MTIQLPGPEEGGVYGPPLQTSAPPAAPGPRPEVAAALDRLQAQDDALFVATSLADLAARHGAALGRAEAAGFSAPDPSPADGFALRHLQALDAEVDGRISAAAGRQGPRPSDGALDLFRRQADGLGRQLLARGALGEHALNRHAQARSVLAAVDGLAGLAAADADALDEAETRLAAVTAASAPLFGPDGAVRLHERERGRLAEAAVTGLIGRDPDEALARLNGGGFDDRLDTDARTRLAQRAEARRAAMAADADRQRDVAALTAVRERAARSFSFERDWRKGLADGGASLASLTDAQAEGVIGPARAARLRTELEDADRMRQTRAALAARAGEVLDAGGAFDPASADDRDAVDAHFRTALLPELGNQPTAEAAATIADYVVATGIVPDDGLRRLVGSMLSEDAETQTAAATALNRVMTLDPSAVEGLPRPMVRRAVRVAEFRDLGVSSERALALAKKAEQEDTRAEQAGLEADDADENGSSGNLTSGAIRRGADAIADGLDGYVPDVDFEEQGPSAEPLTSGALGRAADEMADSFDAGNKQRKGHIGIEDDAVDKITKEERDKAAKMRDALQHERDVKKHLSETRVPGRGPASGGRGAPGGRGGSGGRGGVGGGIPPRFGRGWRDTLPNWM